MYGRLSGTVGEEQVTAQATSESLGSARCKFKVRSSIYSQVTRHTTFVSVLGDIVGG
jgi:hypothetical protein